MEIWQIVLIVVGVILFLGFVVLVWYISTLNNFRRMVVKIDESESSIDVALTKRFDLLTKMVAATKGYTKHEQETLEKVIAMRKPATGATMAQKTEFANELTKGLSAINVVVEQYPTLKADSTFLKLQDASAEVEENLQATRRFYNSNVRIYNSAIIVFPGNIVAKGRGFTPRDFFEAEAAKKEDVKFDF
ncbi:MAG: LemA family protein [Erysipelotrichaceae bacterium]|nr:LemA family protein [Erysipelotrichaceae bacterium]